MATQNSNGVDQGGFEPRKSTSPAQTAEAPGALKGAYCLERCFFASGSLSYSLTILHVPSEQMTMACPLLNPSRHTPSLAWMVFSTTRVVSVNTAEAATNSSTVKGWT